MSESDVVYDPMSVSLVLVSKLPALRGGNLMRQHPMLERQNAEPHDPHL